jgi:hypothetical protein
MNDTQLIWEAYKNIQTSTDGGDEYFEAYRSDDKAKAQEMVNAKAQSLRLVPAYHGSPNELDDHTFNDQHGPYRGGLLAFFSEDKRFAEGYGSKVYSVFLKLKNPLDFRDRVDITQTAEDFYNYEGGVTDSDDIHILELGDGKDVNEKNKYRFYPLDKFIDKLLQGHWDAFECDQFQEYLINSGDYDGIVMKENGPVLSVTYGIYQPNQAKLSDPFTFDDMGKLIPLSERFDFDMDDIRY